MNTKSLRYFSLFSVLSSSPINTTVEDVQKIIDRPLDRGNHIYAKELEHEIDKLALSHMDPHERETVLNKLHRYAVIRAGERSVSSRARILSYIYKAIFGGALLLTIKYIVHIAMPGRFGVIGQTFNGMFVAASVVALLYTGKKVVDHYRNQQISNAAQRRVTYFETLKEAYKTT